MQPVPTFADIVITAGQVTECAACLPPLSARARRGRRTPADLSLDERKQVRACLRTARTALEDALTRYTANCPQPEETLTREAARLCARLSASAAERRPVPGVDVNYAPPVNTIRELTALTDRLTRLIADCPTLTDWRRPDVMVGSLRSEEQYRINLEKSFYYTPVRVVPPDALPVKYVCLCRSASSPEPGIAVFGEVRTIRTVRRSRIPVPTSAPNGSDLYYLLPVKEWQTLPQPVAVREEGIYAPRYTNLFLLTHSRATYELFCITSEAAYRLHAALVFLADAASDPSAPQPAPVRVNDSLTVSLTDGCFTVSDARAVPLSRLPLSGFRAAPGRSLRALLSGAGVG